MLNPRETYELIQRVWEPADSYIFTRDEAQTLIGLISPAALAEVLRDRSKMIDRRSNGDRQDLLDLRA